MPTENVRAALAAVNRVMWKQAFVYKTDALISKKVKVAVEISGAEAPKISYPLAVVKSSKEPERAKKFAELSRRSSRAGGLRKVRLRPGESRLADDGRSMADRFFHDQDLGAQHAADPAARNRGRLAACPPRLAGKSVRGDGGDAAALRAAGRDRIRVAHAFRPPRVRSVRFCSAVSGWRSFSPGAPSFSPARSCRFRCSCAPRRARFRK